MDMHEFWRWIHILLLTFWLGTDVGVFICGAWIRRAGLTDGERVLLLKVSSLIDLWPRVSAALMLPAGVMLARAWGTQVDATWVVLAWAVAIAWLALTVAGMKLFGTPGGQTVQKITAVFLVVVAGVCFWAGGAWLAANAGQPTAWVGTKLLLYGAVCLLAIGIEKAFGPVIAGFGMLADPARRAEADGLIDRGMVRTLGVVGTLYVVLIVASWIGVAKPM
jgi:hypothetical protein